MVGIIRRSTTIPLVSTSMFVAVVAPTELLLDAYPSAALAYSFRKLRTAYAGSAARIRRSSDDAEADIGFSGNDFDAAAAATHIGGGSGFIVTMYDQSGNGKDMAQLTAANQPLYSAMGLEGLPTADLDGTNDQWAANLVLADFGSGTSMTAMFVMQQDATAGANVLFSWNNGSDCLNAYVTYSDDVIYWDFGSGGAGGRVSVGQPGGWDDATHILELFRDSSDNQAIVSNGTSLVSATRTDDLSGSAGNFQLGALGGSAFNGKISEAVFWGTDLGGPGRTGARTDMNTYYTVF